jgi:1,2-diacylglycerol 3-alpha-glucosyltransferase
MHGRLHIAHFTNAYHPVVNGVVRSVDAFRRSLIALGHNVFVFAHQSSNYEDSEPFIFRYPAIELPVANNLPVAIPISPFIDRVLPLLKPDVVHSHHPFLLGRTAAHKAAELDLPFVFTFHTRYRDYSHYVSLNQKLVKEAIDRWLGDYMEHAHHIIAPSASIRDLLAEEYGVTTQVTVLPTGIDLEPYRQADGRGIRQQRGWQEKTILISVGRLAKEKNWETLLKAVHAVVQSGESVRLAILGGGDDRADLEAYCQELGTAEQVEFVGVVPFDEVPDYLKAADIFVFASVTETQGLVTMEAMAAGLPVVAVEASGTSDAVSHGREGLLTANDSQALGEAILAVVRNPELRQQFRAAALARAQTFAIQTQAKKLTAVYEQAIEDKRANRLVKVDRHKPVFKLEWWEMLGLEKSPFQTAEEKRRATDDAQP